MKSIVVCMQCPSYDQPLVNAAVARGIQLLGGTDLFAKPNETILLKPNVLNGLTAQNHIITPTPVFRAVVAAFARSDAKLVYGDSTGFFSSEYHMKASGYAAVAAELAIPHADFDHGRSVSHPSPLICPSLPLVNAALDADGIISLPKLKTHGLVRYTGAIKNQFGCVLGAAKGRYHAIYPDVNDFAKMLVDISSYLKPRLYIMDGIVAMEGPGPMGGDPRSLGVMLFSTDPVALDAVACKIIAMDPYFVPTAKAGEAGGLGTAKLEDITILGDSVDEFITPDFKIVRSYPPAYRPKKSRFQFLAQLVFARPVIQEKKCTKCGRCVEVCPVAPKAVDWRDGTKKLPPVYDYSRCIRCFCCHEFCAFKAIKTKTPIFGKLLTAFSSLLIVFGKKSQNSNPRDHGKKR